MSRRCILVTNAKGGTGKTTFALNLAAGFKRVSSTCLLDADPQQSSTEWHRLADADDLPALCTPLDEDLRGLVASCKQQYETVVIDTAPNLRFANMGTLLTACDYVLIPTQPSPLDLWATISTFQALDLNAGAKKIKAFVVLNQLDAKNTLSLAMSEAMSELNIPLFEHGIRRRAAYRTAAVEGCSVYGLGKRGAQAAQEIDAIVQEILQHEKLS